jgi:NAD-dependent DNA ligase
LVRAPQLDAVWYSFQEFIGDLPLVAHNATQDIKKLISALAGYGLELPDKEYFDTMTIARNSPHLEAEDSYSLEDLCNQLELDWFEVTRDSGSIGHGAAIDAIGCGQLFLKLLDHFDMNSEKAMEALDMRSGQIKKGLVHRGNTKNPKGNFWAQMKSFSVKDFETMKLELTSQGIVFREDHIFSGKNFVLTLDFDGWSEPEIWTAIALAGGEMKGSVTKKVDYLLEGIDSTGKRATGTTNKSKDARALNQSGAGQVHVLNQGDFVENLGPEIIALVEKLKGN